MSDYYRQMSTSLRIKNKAQAKWLQRFLPVTTPTEHVEYIRRRHPSGILHHLRGEAILLKRVDIHDYLAANVRPCEEENSENGLSWSFENDENDRPFLWLRTEHGGESLELTAALIQLFLCRFKIKEPWTVTWACTCSKPELDAFSGGGLVVTRTEMHWLDTSSWCQEKVKSLL